MRSPGSGIRAPMPDPRLFLAQPLSEGARLRLDEGQSRYLATVLRRAVGAPVRVFNVADGEWRAEIDAKDRQGLTLIVRARLRAPASGPDLDLLFAPVKRDATDLIVEKATELGVRRLRPVLTARTIVDVVRLDRLAAIAREAAEQTERLDVPEVLALTPLAKALDGWAGERALIYADEQGDDPAQAWGGAAGRAAPIAAALHSVKGAALAVLIGPEGGFEPGERRLLRSLPFVIPVSLGPRILRAETAAIATLALVQSLWGDWR
ncbi:MAG: 16S rRNA (uracil(1498)-N(3))-methyltransferase [Hyphomonadaceae bacterium]|nr:16S rRNA (uracil(1498)-N(3))-methyltransferase [Hyphomonadaceae bacterium]